MKNLIIKSFIIVLAFYAFDVSMGRFLDKLLDDSPDGRYFKAKYSLEESNEDIIIFGSSRAETNYVPFILEDSLGMSCWNAGRGGQGLPFVFALQQGILERYTPKLVIINIENNYLSPDDGAFERAAGILRPFYEEHEEIRPMIDRISYKERFLMNSRLYSYNSSFYYLLRPFFFRGVDGNIEDNGWKPTFGIIKPSTTGERIIHNTDAIDTENVKLFNEFVNSFIERGSKVIICLTPDYKKQVINTSTIEYVKKMKNVTLIDFSNEKFFTENHKFYIDPIHLNRDGAIEFSKKLSQEIRRKTLKNS